MTYIDIDIEDQTAPLYTATCHRLCSLREDAIGKTKSDIITVLYEGPQSNIAEYGRLASKVLGKRIPPSNLRRHIEHFREVTSGGDERPPTFDSYEQLLADTEASNAEYGDDSWKPVIYTIQSARKKYGDELTIIEAVYFLELRRLERLDNK